jgi:hypothetical protein
MGPLPAVGQWVRLEVPASQVGLEGSILKGMDFSAYGGRATWDLAGKTSALGDGGTNTNSTPVAVPSAISKATGGAMRLTWPSVVGKTYRVGYKNDLADPTWTYSPGDITATSPISTWNDATAASASKRFYRIFLMN